MIFMATHEAGTELTCGHEGCGCRVHVEVPCHGSGAGEPHRCACGDDLVPVQ
ncbi:metallothionein [Mycobacterium pseudokansasii]|uniref:metallothionein n=1 Tax=Mycobacterium pseudokansasii TaxID=2341080 RepID=UPI0023EF6329|nr:metallothionein [Mycobacterium pseudokansasii]